MMMRVPRIMGELPECAWAQFPRARRGSQSVRLGRPGNPQYRKLAWG